MIEFAFVVILLVALVYGIVSVGISLAAKSSITQAAEDGARAGIVATGSSVASSAQSQALGDLGWMVGTVTCASANISCQNSAGATCPLTSKLCVNAYTTSGSTTNLTVLVTYNYKQFPIFPTGPGLGILDPANIASSATLQVSTPTS
ncbi:MAG TPA: TadE family protein [Acidimicrobiales bacterium]|jgi:Flp pilus assembly protein TadG